MKIQAINNTAPNTNVNKRNLNFGWFGGPMEQNVCYWSFIERSFL